jgi:hypothetical protein
VRIVVKLTLAAAAILTAALAGSLAGCGGGPSEQACKAAMKQQYATALTTGQQGHEPAECKGLPDAVLQKLAAQVLSGQ